MTPPFAAIALEATRGANANAVTKNIVNIAFADIFI
jgi:hypothetical protein